jgi:hypothetical protein
MRKRARRLTLNRETLRRLERLDLAKVAGGNTQEIYTTCACTDTCDTNWSCGCGTGGTDTGTCTQELITTCVC